MTGFLQGSYALDLATVDRVVTQRSAGTFILGHKSTGRMFVPAFVGRADNNLNVRLKQLSVSQAYSDFMFQYCDTAEGAFAAECEVFHTFALPGNKTHPTRPPGVDWKCPGCAAYD